MEVTFDFWTNLCGCGRGKVGGSCTMEMTEEELKQFQEVNEQAKEELLKDFETYIKDGVYVDTNGLKAEDAADLILEFDRLAPLILGRIEDKVMEWKQKQLTLSLIKSSVSGVIESLKMKKRIAVPDKVIRCLLEELEGRLLKEFGIQDKDQCNDMHQSEYNTSGRK